MLKRFALVALVPFLVIVLAAPAWAVQYAWHMESSAVLGITDEAGGSNRDMALWGDYTNLTNSVRWNDDTSWGEVLNSGGDNPGTAIVALGVRFTAELPSGVANYSGNLAQKGRFSDGEQIKLQITDANGGTVQCRLEGSTGVELWSSTVTGVADGNQHWAYCSRNGTTLKLTVDGTDTFGPATSIGDISPARVITAGNVGSGGGADDQHYGKNFCTAYAHNNGDTGAIAFVEDQVSVAATC